MMVKRFFIFCMLLCCMAVNAFADHIKGGEIYYSFTGTQGNNYSYHITVKLYMVCNSTRQFNDPAFVSFFKKGTNERVTDIRVPLERTELQQLQERNPCILNPPEVCSRIGYYQFDITLPASEEGYIIATQIIYRVDGLVNLTKGYDRIGATYIGTIPGTNAGSTAPQNNSARFIGKDQVIICSGNNFSYSFGAEDKDGDKLRYSLCAAYQGGESFFGNAVQPPEAPPYAILPYAADYSGGFPLGQGIGIDENTGIISGTAPAPGIYVLSVCVDEIRDGIIIATQHKDLQVNVASCSVVSAKIPDPFMLCGDSKTLSISGGVQSGLITSYNWQLFNAQGAAVYTSSGPTVNYTFTDTGVYKLKLAINTSVSCSDSATGRVLVYPGFVPGFSYEGICATKATYFKDTSTNIYGKINKWNWDFGDGNSVYDSSASQNPVYAYSTEGQKKVRMIVANSKGCVDTVYKNISVFLKPPVQLAFRDTLICMNDKLLLKANGGGNFKWWPAINITGAGTATPEVSPTGTTIYYVEMDQQGCINRDSVTVHVEDHVALQTMNDTTICSGDTIQLRIVSNGLKYTWSPAPQINDPKLPNPSVKTNSTTSYSVTSAIGGCTATRRIKVSTVPYPFAFAGNDTLICFQTSAYLHGATDGSIFTWSPQASLQLANTLSPVAFSGKTTPYILTAYDTKGCPKPGFDTVLVTVLPQVKAFAGNDTSVVVNQPLQFNAGTGETYKWFPATGLSNANVPDPVGIYTAPADEIKYKLLVSNAAGCSDSDFVVVKVYKVLPTVFVPTGFTPNKDGRNDVLKPIAVGLQRIIFFAVYNRWGQMIFNTSENGKGWDGTINSKLQNSGSYVWMVKAIDYAGKPYFQRGMVTLIR